MSGEKLNTVKTATTDLAKAILNNKNNMVSLITFETESAIESYFTNDEELITDKINNIVANGNTNYSNALRNVGIRPVISLKPETEYYDGDGSASNPYKVELNN